MGANCLLRLTGHHRDEQDSGKMEEGEMKMAEHEGKEDIDPNKSYENTPFWVALKNKLQQTSFSFRSKQSDNKGESANEKSEQLQPLIDRVTKPANDVETIASSSTTLTLPSAELSEVTAAELVPPLVTSPELMTSPTTCSDGPTYSVPVEQQLGLDTAAVKISRDENYSLKVVLQDGKNLAARDSNGDYCLIPDKNMLATYAKNIF